MKEFILSTTKQIAHLYDYMIEFGEPALLNSFNKIFQDYPEIEEFRWDQREVVGELLVKFLDKPMMDIYAMDWDYGKTLGNLTLKHPLSDVLIALSDDLHTEAMEYTLSVLFGESEVLIDRNGITYTTEAEESDESHS